LPVSVKSYVGADKQCTIRAVSFRPITESLTGPMLDDRHRKPVGRAVERKKTIAAKKTGNPTREKNINIIRVRINPGGDIRKSHNAGKVVLAKQGEQMKKPRITKTKNRRGKPEGRVAGA